MSNAGNCAGEFVQIIATNMEGFETLSMKKENWTLLSNNSVSATYESDYQLKNFRIKQTNTIYHYRKKMILNMIFPIGQVSIIGN
ncbi:MAG: hypothetical protein K0M50_05760 [Prolixibacteraceae bacterium]|nr:hypothetical protein [Prolixibacteraceae bacterium]